MRPQALVLIDYQNVHISAHEAFEPRGSRLAGSRIHPGRFADRIAITAKQVHLEFDIAGVRVFRGVPDPRRDPRLNSLVLAEHSRWRRDPRVSISTRPLRYPAAWPSERAQEKGIDVMLALTLLRAAIDGQFDRIVVATRDTDLIPAIEMAETERPGVTALATWRGRSVLRVGVPAIPLTRDDYLLSRDAPS